uniref:peptidylprolyl isomerase n=1 Tax=Pedobacter sp. TaxID=1411316 RepID=UPI003D7F6325
MKIIKVFIAFMAFLMMAFHVDAQSRLVRLETNKGNITLLLYDQTPAHRDAFIKTVQEGLFNDAAFNRVIKSFVSQA